MQNNQTFIISLGGSLIVPGAEIDWKFLKKFREIIINETKNGKRFFIIAGGGYTCRNYLQAADKILKLDDAQRDWLGIHATRLNANLIRIIFKDIAHKEIITNPTIKIKTNKNIIVGSGWKPGWSTDYVSTIIAQNNNAKTVINLSNIDFAYDKDPRKHKDAKKLLDVSWIDFRKIVGNKWSPGLNAPFDPIASRKASQLKLRVIIANGKNLGNLKNILNDKKFKGTVIA